jgi:hypothetical protein
VWFQLVFLSWKSLVFPDCFYFLGGNANLIICPSLSTTVAPHGCQTMSHMVPHGLALVGPQATAASCAAHQCLAHFGTSLPAVELSLPFPPVL